MSELTENKIQEDQKNEGSLGRKGAGVITFIDVAAILWKRRVLLTAVLLTVVVGTLAYLAGSILLPAGKSYLPNLYTAEASIVIGSEGDGSSITSAALYSNAGASGLLAKHDIPSPVFDYGGFAQDLATADATIDDLDVKFGFSKRQNDAGKASSMANVHGFIKKSIRTEFDPGTRIFRVSFTDYDPVLAKSVVDEIVRLLDVGLVGYREGKFLEARNILEKKLSYMDDTVKNLKAEMANTPPSAAGYGNLHRDLQVQSELSRILAQEYGLIKLTMAVQEPLLRVKSAAEVPVTKSSPSRTILFFWAIIAGFSLAIFLVVLVEAIEKIRADPDTASRFRAVSSKKTVRGKMG